MNSASWVNSTNNWQSGSALQQRARPGRALVHGIINGHRNYSEKYLLHGQQRRCYRTEDVCTLFHAHFLVIESLPVHSHPATLTCIVLVLP